MSRQFWILISLALALSASAQPQFQVATIKPAAPLGPSDSAGLRRSGDRVDIRNWSLKQLILSAYGLETYQATGPDWIEAARFDIAATLPANATRAQMNQMIQQLLQERFSLATHRERRILSGIALVTARGGHKMQSALGEVSAVTLDELMGDGGAFGTKTSIQPRGVVRMEFARVPIQAIAQIASSYLRQPVFDETKLPGLYKATLEFSPGDATGSSLRTAIDDLGLRLENRRGPVDMLIVDRASRTPTQN